MRYLYVDFDDTMTHVHPERQKAADEKDWERYHSMSHLDKPNRDMLRLLRQLQLHRTFRFISILTGTPDQYRTRLKSWMRENYMYLDLEIPLIMRAEFDHSTNEAFKARILLAHHMEAPALRKKDVLLIDDRQENCETAANLGFRAIHNRSDTAKIILAAFPVVPKEGLEFWKVVKEILPTSTYEP